MGAKVSSTTGHWLYRILEETYKISGKTGAKKKRPF